MSQLNVGQLSSVCMKREKYTSINVSGRSVYFFNASSGDKLGACWLFVVCHLCFGGNHATQPAHNFFHHAFFCEGHSEVGVAAAISAAPAPVDLPLRFLGRAVTTGSFPKETIPLPFTALLHAGRPGQPESHQLRRLREWRKADLPEHADGTGPTGGDRSAGGDVWESESLCRPPAGDRAGGSRWQ